MTETRCVRLEIKRRERKAQTLEISPSSQSPLREVWAIAWPTVLTMTSYTVMQFVDKLMVGQVGPLQVAAQGNGGVWAFSLIAFVLGLLTVVNTYVSQNLGAGQPEKGPDYAWAAIWLCLGIWLLFVLPYSALMGSIFDLVHDAQLEGLKQLLARASGADLLRAQGRGSPDLQAHPARNPVRPNSVGRSADPDDLTRPSPFLLRAGSSQGGHGLCSSAETSPMFS